MKVKLPKSITQLRVRHIEALSKVEFEKLSILERAVICSKFVDVDIETVRRFAFQDVVNIMEHHFRLIASYKPTELPKEITVNEQEYCLIGQAAKMPTSWHIDMSAFKMTDTTNIAAFFYIEKHLDYCTMDNHSNIINPVGERAKVFREHLELPILLDLREAYNIEVTALQERLYGKPKKKNQVEPERNRYDWHNAVNFVSTHLNLAWEEVVKNNIFWFKDKCDYFNYVQRQKK